MSVIAGQFARPHGPLGKLIGRGMARRNAAFSRWVMQQVGEHCPDPGKIAELGPGPGIGLQEALRQFGAARVWGIDPSPEMLAQSIAPLDVVTASHVLYFWHQPADELLAIRRCLRPGGLLALGYQLRQNMPPMAQKHFPRQGHVLYESDDQVARLLRSAGFAAVSYQVKGPAAAPEGRVALATA